MLAAYGCSGKLPRYTRLYFSTTRLLCRLPRFTTSKQRRRTPLTAFRFYSIKQYLRMRYGTLDRLQAGGKFVLLALPVILDAFISIILSLIVTAFTHAAHTRVCYALPHARALLRWRTTFTCGGLHCTAAPLDGRTCSTAATTFLPATTVNGGATAATIGFSRLVSPLYSILCW